MQIISNERGISLIEVLASLIIITIIFLSFFNFFIQSKKTNASSELIHDATYIAQVEMEKMYILASKSNSKNELDMTYQKTELTSCTPNNNDPTEYSSIYKTTSDSEHFTTHITISMICNYKNAGNVNIDVFEKSTNLKRATIENIYIWK